MNNKVKGLIFISNVHRAMEHEWFIEFTNKNEFDFEFVLFNSYKSDLYNFIKVNGFKCKNYDLKTKLLIPFYVIYFFMKMLFRRYDFVHCHLFEASLIGLLSSKLACIKKRIYTRHHADFHHTYFPKAVKYDLLNNMLSTHIIAVSKNIQKLLIDVEHVAPSKIIVIPHGIPSKIIHQQTSNSDIEAIKKQYGFDKNSPVIGVISRFTEWKGIQYIIPAFKEILKDFPNAKLVMANASGDYEKVLTKLLNDEIPQNSYVLIKFENNSFALFKSFDVFVHVPIDPYCEAFGQVYIEALANDIPMVCTLSGIANDFIINKENALVVNYKNSDSIHYAVKEILNNPQLKIKITTQGKTDIEQFTFESKFGKIKALYLD